MAIGKDWWPIGAMPAVTGFFWWRQDPNGVPEMVHVIRDKCTREHGTDSLLAVFIAGNSARPVEEVGGQWLGPVESPHN